MIVYPVTTIPTPLQQQRIFDVGNRRGNLAERLQHPYKNVRTVSVALPRRCKSWQRGLRPSLIATCGDVTTKSLYTLATHRTLVDLSHVYLSTPLWYRLPSCPCITKFGVANSGKSGFLSVFIISSTFLSDP